MAVNQPPVISTDEDERTFCEVHPDRETGLRCNKCGRLICTECAVQTPVGYRCRECVRGQEEKFFKANNADNVINFAVTSVLTGIASVIIFAVGVPLLFVIILGIPIGGGISELALRATQRKRSRYSGQIGAAAAVIGGLTGATFYAWGRLNEAYALVVERFGERAAEVAGTPSLDQAFTLVINQLPLLLFIGMIAFAVYGRYRMR